MTSPQNPAASGLDLDAREKQRGSLIATSARVHAGTTGAASVPRPASVRPGVDKLTKLKQAGCDGIRVALFDFAPDLEFFGEAALPVMFRAGLRIR